MALATLGISSSENTMPDIEILSDLAGNVFT
jgi:hypothetical protein